MSFDGLPEVQDRHRLTIAGQGSSNRVMHTIRRFDEAGFRYGLRVTVTADHSDAAGLSRIHLFAFSASTHPSRAVVPDRTLGKRAIVGNRRLHNGIPRRSSASPALQSRDLLLRSTTRYSHESLLRASHKIHSPSLLMVMSQPVTKSSLSKTSGPKASSTVNRAPRVKVTDSICPC